MFGEKSLETCNNPSISYLTSPRDGLQVQASLVQRGNEKGLIG